MTALPAKGAAYGTLIANRSFIVLDIETTTAPATDTDPETVYPISIGAVLLLNGTRRDTFHELTDPGVAVDAASSAHNGITTPDLAGEADNATTLAALDTFLAKHPDAHLVCHNAHYDVPHLHSAYARAGMTPFSYDVIDTQFLPVRLRLDGVSSRPKLTALAAHYGVATTLPRVPEPRRRLHKALLDAQNTAEVLCWLLAEAAAQGITEFDDFLAVAKPRSSADLASHHARQRRRRPRNPAISAKHIKATHGARRMPTRATRTQIDAWVQQVRTCVALHCPHAAGKVTVEAHRIGLLDRLTPLLADCTDPGDAGTLLGIIEPLLVQLDRYGARDWYGKHHTAIKDAPSCNEMHACPHCVAGQPCPKDTTYHLLTRRALDYGIATHTGEPVSLFSRKVKDDLWDVGRHRKMDTWPRQGMHDMAAYMMWMLLDEAYRKGNTTRELDILTKAVERKLPQHDPRLALHVVRHWAKDPRKTRSIERLVENMRATVTTDPGYLVLEMWFDGPFQRLLIARAAAKRRTAKRKARGLRKVALIERRPAKVQHTYRYQLHRGKAV